jgi:hypothetical protein
VQLAKSEAMESAQKKAQVMIEEAKTEHKKVTEAMELEKSNLEKLLSSVNEELQYWQTRSKRTEAACNTLQADVMSLARMLPEDMASMTLAVQGKISRTLIERASEGMDQLVALDEEWLPPLDAENGQLVTAAAQGKENTSNANAIPRRKSRHG